MCFCGFFALISKCHRQRFKNGGLFCGSDSDEEEARDNNVYGYPNDFEGRNFAENDQSIESTESDFDSDDSSDNQNAALNGVSEVAFVKESTVGYVFISSQRNVVSDQPRPRKRRRAMTAAPDEARRTQQQPRPQFTWNQNNLNNTVPEFLLRPGPTRVWGGESSPVNCFQLFWDDELFEFLTEMTNKNAERKRTENPEKHKSPWRPITCLSEMKAFIGVCVAMGILKLPDLHDYWQTSYRLFEIIEWNEHMNRDRFKAIMRYLKFCDEEVDKPQPREGQDQASPNKLYKVRRFLNKLLQRYEWTSH